MQTEAKKTIYVVHDEAAISSRKDHSRGAATVDQIHHIHFVTKTTLRVTKRPRKNGIGSTAGNAVNNIGVPGRNAGWQLLVKDKKRLYGTSKRVLPSGPGEKPELLTASSGVQAPVACPRKDTDVEPFTFWAASDEFYKEVLNYDIKAVVDMNSCDMTFAETCARQQIPYFGICFTPEHVTKGYDILAGKMFKSFVEDKQSPNYDSELSKLFNKRMNVLDQLQTGTGKGAKTNQGKAKETAPKNSDLQKQLKELQKKFGQQDATGGSGEEDDEGGEEDDEQDSPA